MLYSIKEVTEMTGVSAYTLRFYEKEGVLPHVKRDEHGNRTYIQGDMEWIETVQVFRSTGLSLGEIKEYLELYQGGNSTLQRQKELMVQQKENVEFQVAKLMKTLEKINYRMALFDVQEKKLDMLP